MVRRVVTPEEALGRLGGLDAELGAGPSLSLIGECALPPAEAERVQHAAGSTVHAPALEGLIGRTVHLQDGRSIVADETYVRDSILLPRKDVVAGYAPVMPSFAGQLDEDDIVAIVAWLRSTSTAPGGTR